MGSQPLCVLIANPRSGAGSSPRALDRMVADLRSWGFAAEAAWTRAPGHATELAAEAAQRGARTVVAVGGDGTIREVAAGLSGLDTSVAILPAGTTNVLARALGIRRHPLRALSQLFEPRRDGLPPSLDVSWDSGLCNGHRFLMMASAGVDSRALALVRPGLKRRFGRLAVALAGVESLVRFRPALDYSLRTDAEEIRCSFFALCNIPLYGGNYRLAPGADPTDGCGDLVAWRQAGRRSTVGLVARVLAQRRLEAAPAIRRRVRTVDLSCDSDAIQVQIDGDLLVLTTPVRFQMLPGSVRFLEPRRDARPRRSPR